MVCGGQSVPLHTTPPYTSSHPIPSRQTLPQQHQTRNSSNHLLPPASSSRLTTETSQIQQSCRYDGGTLFFFLPPVNVIINIKEYEKFLLLFTAVWISTLCVLSCMHTPGKECIHKYVETCICHALNKDFQLCTETRQEDISHTLQL